MKNQSDLKIRAENGDVEAMYDYGVVLYFEKRDYETALQYLLHAASNNYELAYGEIGVIMCNETQDYVAAEKWFDKIGEEE
ncbi:hypothetical protein H8E88_14885 [candidate division KSB1 bacterium]|nr:hypothetical protein [candidate division KSB1 bacterium]